MMKLNMVKLLALVVTALSVACGSVHADPLIDGTAYEQAVKQATAGVAQLKQSEQSQVESTSEVLIADEKSGSWWGYSENGGITVCTRDGFDEMSPRRASLCKPKESGTPVKWQIMDYERSFGGGSPGLLGLLD